MQDQTLHELALSLADLVTNNVVELLEEERYFGHGDADVINEMTALARGAVSDRFNELLDENNGWTQQLVDLPLWEACQALQTVRQHNNQPIRNQPTVQVNGKTSGRKRRRRKRKRGGGQKKLPGTDQQGLDPADEENYDPHDPFYVGGPSLTPEDQQYLADQAAQDDFWANQEREYHERNDNQQDFSW